MFCLGKEVIGQRGNLVISNPFPSMPIMNLQPKKDWEKLKEALLAPYPGIYIIFNFNIS